MLLAPSQEPATSFSEQAAGQKGPVLENAIRLSESRQIMIAFHNSNIIPQTYMLLHKGGTALKRYTNTERDVASLSLGESHQAGNRRSIAAFIWRSARDMRKGSSVFLVSWTRRCSCSSCA